MTWHFTRFRVRPAREQAVFAARTASLQPCWDASPPLRAAYLLALGDQEWLDVTVWDGEWCGESPGSAPVAARPAFFEQLDELLGEECAVAVARDLPVTLPNPQGGPAGAVGGGCHEGSIGSGGTSGSSRFGSSGPPG
jgi:hypothetical protein